MQEGGAATLSVRRRDEEATLIAADGQMPVAGRSDAALLSGAGTSPVWTALLSPQHAWRTRAATGGVLSPVFI